MTSMINIKGLYKSFGKQQVLKGLNLEVEEGHTMVVIGTSGCGKSVLLKHIVGLMRPQRGTVTVDGDDLTTLSGKRLDSVRMKMGMLFQGSALFDSLTVRDNVGFALLEHTKLPGRLIDKRVAECLELVSLSGIENKKPAELSGGMKKRVGLARAICMNPQIILYDEPTTGIDPVMADAINDLIIQLREKLGNTSIVVTHDMRSACKVGESLAMLHDGKIVEVGSVDQVRKSKNPVVREFVTSAGRFWD